MLTYLEPFDEGEIIYKNKSLDQMKQHHYFRDHMGYLFQNFGLIENETIQDNLKLGFIGQKIAKDEKIARQKEALSQVNLDYLSLSDKIYTLSGGEAQRTA